MKILLVEPDYVLAKAYKSILIDDDHDITVSSSAQDAVYNLSKQNFDLVVIEIQLAGHNGTEFIYEFRSYPEWADIPIIILSMVPKESFSVAPSMFRDLGIIDYLYKPVTKSYQLLDAVSDILIHDAWIK